MGRHFIFVSALVALSIFGTGSAFAQDPRKGHHSHGQNFQQRSKQFRHGPERVLRLSPEEQQTFRRNAERWLQMDPQQRDALRQRDRVLRERMRNEAETIMRDSGLRLDNGAREQFEERYLQERRRIEQSLRREIEAKREQQLPELKERLRNEFQPRPSLPPASASPSGSNKPGN